MSLTSLGSDNNFTAGDLEVVGYFAAVPAYQRVFVADGRPHNLDISESGYHKIDMTSTILVGASSGVFTIGETVTQATSEAAGIFVETIGSGATAKHLVYRTTTTEFNATYQVTGAQSAVTLTPSAVKAPPHWLNWHLTPNAFSSDGAGTVETVGTTALAGTDTTFLTTFKVGDTILVEGESPRYISVITSDVALTVSEAFATTASELTYKLPCGRFPDGGSNAMELFDGRMWMNSMFNPNQYFTTRQGDMLDLDTSLDDVQAAFNSQTSETGLVADAIITFIKFKDNYLLFACANSFSILRGGSSGAGAINNLSSETGIFSPDSFCWDNNGNLYVIGLSGFFKFPNNMAVSGVGIDNISLRKVPDLFRTLQLNRKTDRVVMGFDKGRNIIRVSISTQDGVWSVAFCYDINTDSILPDTFVGDKVPSSFLYMNSYQDSISGLLVGCYDGYIRKEDSTVNTDDGDLIESYVLFGPITLNNLLRANVKAKEILVTLTEDSDGVEWELYAAKSNELLVSGIKAGTLDPIHSGTFESGGRQFPITEKIADESIALMLRNDTSDTSWGLENIKIRWVLAGKTKN